MAGKDWEDWSGQSKITSFDSLPCALWTVNANAGLICRENSKIKNIQDKTKNTNGIVKLTLSNFRNYKDMRLALDSRSLVLTGDNGAGKTNILEAISLLGRGSGLRNSKLSEIGSR